MRTIAGRKKRVELPLDLGDDWKILSSNQSKLPQYFRNANRNLVELPSYFEKHREIVEGFRAALLRGLGPTQKILAKFE